MKLLQHTVKFSNPLSQRTRWTNFFTFAATHTFGGRKIFRRIKFNRTNFFATSASNTFIGGKVELVAAVFVEQTVNRAEWTHYAAKKSVGDNAPCNHGEQD